MRSFEEGYVALGELTEFIYRRRNERFADRKSRWIVEGLDKLASWDVVVSRDGQRHYGTLVGEGLSLRTPCGEKHTVRYSDTEKLGVSSGGRFSASDEVEVVTASSDTLGLLSSFGAVRLDDFGRTQSHRLRGVRSVEVGTHRHRQYRNGALLRE